MNAPIKATANKIAREQHRNTGREGQAPWIAPDLLILIDSCCFDSDGYRAPDAKRNLDDEQEIIVHPNAAYMQRFPNKAHYGSEPPQKTRKRVDLVAAPLLEEVYELLRLHGPVTTWEATTRMARAGIPRAVTLRALEVLKKRGKARASTVTHKAEPPAIVYEVAS